jgi:hypothetical protein
MSYRKPADHAGVQEKVAAQTSARTVEGDSARAPSELSDYTNAPSASFAPDPLKNRRCLFVYRLQLRKIAIKEAVFFRMRIPYCALGWNRNRAVWWRKLPFIT